MFIEWDLRFLSAAHVDFCIFCNYNVLKNCEKIPFNFFKGLTVQCLFKCLYIDNHGLDMVPTKHICRCTNKVWVDPKKKKEKKFVCFFFCF